MLERIRIVDLTTGLAGPVATRFLAEQGAEVIKVEPRQGDPTRGSAAFASWNRSKKSITLDLRQPDDRETLQALLGTADVLVHNFRPTKSRELGLDDATLAEAFPHLVVSSLLGYAIDHPDAERPGYDILVQARSGAMDEVLGNREGPIFLRFPLPSWAATYMLSAGILARLIIRDRSGRGGPVHTSLLQGTMAVLMMLWNRVEKPTEMLLSKIPVPRGADGPRASMFQCRDGTWLQTLFGYTEHPLVIETLATMGHEPIEVVNMSPTPAQLDVFRQVFLSRPRSEWLDALSAGDVPCAPVQPLGSLFSDPQVVANDMLVEVDDPTWGRALQPLAPFHTDPPSAVRSPAPLLGAHNSVIDELLSREATTRAVNDRYPRRRPLEGLKVLDIGQYIAGPLGPMMLADMGATVIKLETLAGDRTRQLEILFFGPSRGKRSIAIDLKTDHGSAVLKRLLAWADIVHHNIRMEAARRIGLDYGSVAAVNPKVVYCHVSSYGTAGPKANWPGYDPTAQAESGWGVESAPPGGKPMWYRFGMMDHQAAMASVTATLLGLYRRDQTGLGSNVTSSLLGAVVETNSETMLLLEQGELAPYARVDPLQTGLSEGYRIYQTSDGEWVAVAALGADALSRFRKAVGAADGDDLAAAIRLLQQDELLLRLKEFDVPAEAVRRDYETGFFDDEIGRPSKMAVSYEQHDYGKTEQPGAFWNFGDLELQLDVPPPGLGEHSVEILAELGFDSEAIDSLLAEGIVVQPLGYGGLRRRLGSGSSSGG